MSYLHICEFWYFDAVIFLPLPVHSTTIALPERGKESQIGESKKWEIHYSGLLQLLLHKCCCVVCLKVDDSTQPPKFPHVL